MKMLGPKGVITVGSSIEHAFDCNVKCVEHAEALVLDETLVAPPPSTRAVSRMPNRRRRYPSTPRPEGKVLRVSSTLDPK
jgi:hypothetical protein